jgi:hypothetical protein
VTLESTPLTVVELTIEIAREPLGPRMATSKGEVSETLTAGHC